MAFTPVFAQASSKSGLSSDCSPKPLKYFQGEKLCPIDALRHLLAWLPNRRGFANYWYVYCFRSRALFSNQHSVVLTFVLSRSRTGFQKTDSMINRLIRGAIQTGLFASIFALADLFSFVLHRETNLYAMFAFPIGRIYTNVRDISISLCYVFEEAANPILDLVRYSKCSYQPKE